MVMSDPRLLLGGAAAVALTWLIWSWHQRGADLDAARLSAALASETARANARAVNAVTEAGRRNVQTVTDAAAAERARLLARLTIERRISDAPATHGCAGSPAVTIVLDGLRRRAAGGSPGGGGADDGAGGAAVLPARPGAAGDGG
ncbi:hypothetical protein [Niveispirillum sp.]|uniref:hypothetical protein n=1 Tax=Niveispirillum sp. TaxID=1917217 RepID=UPI001B7B40A4|nr:hypothetical protein [Niveispirillum sp.]MBP7338783.1 hypothetical protein [Niveispirillum sp.]